MCVCMMCSSHEWCNPEKRIYDKHKHYKRLFYSENMDGILQKSWQSGRYNILCTSEKLIRPFERVSIGLIIFKENFVINYCTYYSGLLNYILESLLLYHIQSVVYKSNFQKFVQGDLIYLWDYRSHIILKKRNSSPK